MGQKVNPIAFRLGVTSNWASIWSSDQKQYIKTLYGDLRIREYISNRLSEFGFIIGHCSIKRLNHKLFVSVQILSLPGTSRSARSSKFSRSSRSSKAKALKSQITVIKSHQGDSLYSSTIFPSTVLSSTLNLPSRSYAESLSLLNQTSTPSLFKLPQGFISRVYGMETALTGSVQSYVVDKYKESFYPGGTFQFQYSAKSLQDSLYSSISIAINGSRNTSVDQKRTQTGLTLFGSQACSYSRLHYGFKRKRYNLLTIEKLNSLTFSKLRRLTPRQRKQALLYLITNQLSIFEGLTSTSVSTSSQEFQLGQQVYNPRLPQKSNLVSGSADLELYKQSLGRNIYATPSKDLNLQSFSGSLLNTLHYSYSKTLGLSQTQSLIQNKDISSGSDLSPNLLNLLGAGDSSLSTNPVIRQRSLVQSSTTSSIILRFVYSRFFNRPLVAQAVANLIAKTIYMRKAVTVALQPLIDVIQLSKSRHLGLRVKYSGRINGVEMARTSQLQHGRVPLQSINVPIDYAVARVYTIFGVIGVKVWINKNQSSL